MSNRAPIILVSVGVLLLIATLLIGWVLIPHRAKSKINERLQLVEGTPTWNKWSNITTPIFLSFYIFNTTNPATVKMGGKPILVEYGPYVFEEKRAKIDIHLNKTRGTVSYRQPIYYYYRSDMSNGSLSDSFTVLNVPFLGLTTLGATQGVAAQFVLQYSVLIDHEDEELFVTRNVDQLLFKGYHVPLMETLAEVTGRSPLKNNTFGFYFPKNGSDPGVMEVKTGVGNSMEFGKMVSWNGNQSLDFWKADTCNMINGTDGSIFPPFVQRDQNIQVFVADFCRSLYLKYLEDSEYNEIATFRFGIPAETLSVEPEDSYCFCAKEHKNQCLKTGAFALAPCRRGAPVVMSFPHFFDGDPVYLNMSIGLKPERARHLTYLDFEPNTGAVVRAHKRVQINFQLGPNTLAEEFYHVPNMIYPVLWIDEEATMAVTTQEEIKARIIKPLGIVNIVKWILVGFSLVLIAAGLILHFVRTNKQDYSPAASATGKFVEYVAN